MASKKHPLGASGTNEAPPGKRGKLETPSASKPKVALNPFDCNLDFSIESDGISGSALHNEGFAYCWSGARANFGIRGGKYCFGCRVIENQPVVMEDTAKEQQNLCRVGLSKGESDVGSLGESMSSFGYGGTGKFSHRGNFTTYGGPFGAGDTIICAVDLENPSHATISFAKNGRWLGVGMEFDAGPRGLGITGAGDYKNALFPHILLKNVKIRMMLSIDHGLQPLQGYKAWDAAILDGNAVRGPEAAANCEIIMMVGLPGSGKTTWAEKWCKEHPEKRYMVLGTNLALDQMKVPGLMRKKNYGERFERLMDRATKIFNKLIERASKTSRNFIIDQTNVYRSARIRKLKPFKNFCKTAVVVFPDPEELKRRTCARAQEMGKEVPQEAVNEMLANFLLPNTKDSLNSVEPFDEVRFVELQRNDAERFLAEMKDGLSGKKNESFSSTAIKRSASDRSDREDSKAFRQGSYSSAYALQDIRESPHGPPHLQSQVPYTSAHAPSASYLQDHDSVYGRQSTFPDRFSRDSSISSYGNQQGFARGDLYAQRPSMTALYDDRDIYSRGSTLPHHGLGSRPYGAPLQESYDPGRTGGFGGPAPSSYLTPQVRGYPGAYDRSMAGQYGDYSFPGSGAQQPFPPHRYSY
ncbi:hypothetical protein KP509_29G009600 [Ceratopteris richardii]|uniref:SPRY domain-containing protein n=1 Tax=Ceratopteris richardii TaxID=49495 RepID=A0A8T2R5Q1_CERRI|nr:hypothetical protein KP509_29G009600 [Ceratopteris richardii]